jgi:hypothetical protein
MGVNIPPTGYILGGNEPFQITRRAVVCTRVTPQKHTRTVRARKLADTSHRTSWYIRHKPHDVRDRQAMSRPGPARRAVRVCSYNPRTRYLSKRTEHHSSSRWLRNGTGVRSSSTVGRTRSARQNPQASEVSMARYLPAK